MHISFPTTSFLVAPVNHVCAALTPPFQRAESCPAELTVTNSKSLGNPKPFAGWQTYTLRESEGKF